MGEAAMLGMTAGASCALLAWTLCQWRAWPAAGRWAEGEGRGVPVPGGPGEPGNRAARVLRWLRTAWGRGCGEAEWRGELAAFLDLLVLEVEAGMGLRQAVQEAAQAVRGGRLRCVLESVARDLSMGATLVEAVEARMGGEGIGEEWHSLARGLRLGQRFGIPVAQSLRQLVADMRRRQRQELELHLGLLPLKLSLCGLVFFFPPLIVLLLLPNLLHFLGSQW